MITAYPTDKPEDVEEIIYNEQVWDRCCPKLIQEDIPAFRKDWYHLVLRDEEGNNVGICRYRDATKILVEFHGGFHPSIWGKRSAEAMQAIMDWWKANTCYRKCVTFVPANAKSACKFFSRNGFQPEGALEEGVIHDLLPVTLFMLTKSLW